MWKYSLLENNTNFNIGDYVILDDTGNGSLPAAFWNNWYGKIKDKKYDYNVSDTVFLIEFFNELDDNEKKFINTNGIRMDNMFFNRCYLVKYTKKEFVKTVEKIEIEKTAKKFGL